MFQRVFCLILVMVIRLNLTEKITYLSVEHPAVLYFNTKYLKFVNLTSKRYGRRSPVYYVGLDFYVNDNYYFGNNITIDFYFFEFLSNRYQRSFVEMHFRWCNLIHKDKFFGAAMRQGKLAGPCPYPPGEYNLYNMTVPPEVIPRGFPFTKGRIFANVTLDTTKERLVCAYIDMELKHQNVNKKDFKELGAYKN